MYGSHEGSICELKHDVNNPNETMLLTHVNCSILVLVRPDTTGCSILQDVLLKSGPMDRILI